MRFKPLADELAEIRTELARLKLREAKIRQAILASAEPLPTGRWASVEVVHHRRLAFDASLLPEAIRNDPQYWRETETTTIRTRPANKTTFATRPGWPIQRGSVTGAFH